MKFLLALFLGIGLGFGLTQCGGAPYTFVGPLGESAPDGGDETATAVQDAGTSDTSADILSPRGDAAPDATPEADAGMPEASRDALACDPPAPSATGDCNGVAFHAPDEYCALVYPTQDLTGNAPQQVVMPTPGACLCDYNCACLFAAKQPWCPPATHYGVAVCGVKANTLSLACEDGD